MASDLISILNDIDAKIIPIWNVHLFDLLHELKVERGSLKPRDKRVANIGIIQVFSN